MNSTASTRWGVMRAVYRRPECRFWALLILAFLCLLAASPRGATDEPQGPTLAALQAHRAALLAKIPNGFSVLIQPPFLVIGDEPAAIVQRRATGTVQWAAERLKQDYFKRDPEGIIDVWLFRDAASYQEHAQSLFHETPTTPFGFYSASHHALIMNIETGGGTLVHEMVHPFMQANFPSCPAWFNEGLASLFEQSAERNGHIRGLVNWRLKGLALAIQQRRTISLERLLAMSESEFYGGPTYRQHYGQARYLCFYLQEKGLLVRFYREFVANAKQDPTGVQTLRRVLGEKDLVAFQKKWEAFILKLRFPASI